MFQRYPENVEPIQNVTGFVGSKFMYISESEDSEDGMTGLKIFTII